MSNNIVKHDQLKDIAGDLWTKAKKRDIERFEFDSTTKTLKGKNLVDTTLSIDVALTDLVSINDRAEFKKDVSVDDAKTVSNSNIGNVNGTVAAGSRTTGYRRLTSKLFTDGYVKLLRVYLPENASGTINAHVWMIKKGDSKAEDKLLEPKIHQPLQVLSSGEKKYIDVEIKRKFEEETFFVLRTERDQQIQGIDHIKPEFAEDIINVNASFNPQSTTENINWNNFNPINNLVGHMELHGRTGIVDISKRLEEINLASGNYVLQSETTTTGGETRYANKVVKLGSDGKINSNMIPELAINRVLEAADESAALDKIGEGKDRLQVGDVVVLQNTNKIYIYKGRPDGQNDNNFRRDFLEISMGNGTVKSVNTILPEANGNVTVRAEHIKYNTDANSKTVKQVLDEKISNIILNTSDKKKLTVTKADGHNEDVNLTEAFKANNIAYNKTIAGENKATVENAIDALVAESGKAVKKVSGCLPGTDGNIVVTAKKTDSNIALSFGTGGTDVELFSYMTQEEVNQIKGLFT